MRTRFLIVGTLAGGLVLTVLNWFSAAILPPRYQQFTDPHAVVEAIRANVPGDDIDTAPPSNLVVTTNFSWTTIRVLFSAVVWSPAESAITIATRVARLTGFCRLGAGEGRY